MEHLIEQLKELRKNEKEVTDYLPSFQERLEQTEEWIGLQTLKDSLAGLQDQIKQVDEQVREAALLEYAKTGNKKPANGVSVIINKVLQYDPGRAIRWAVHNAPGMLKLDTRTFEKHAKAVQDTMPIEWVRVSEQPSVRVAREL